MNDQSFGSIRKTNTDRSTGTSAVPPRALNSSVISGSRETSFAADRGDVTFKSAAVKRRQSTDERLLAS